MNQFADMHNYVKYMGRADDKIYLRVANIAQCAIKVEDSVNNFILPS